MSNSNFYRFFRIASVMGMAAFAGLAAPTQGMGKWVASANLTAARAGSCSALLPDGGVLVSGGSGASGALSSAEVLGGRRTNVSSMLTAREEHACVALPSGSVLVAGGKATGGGVTNSAELFQPSTRTWTAISSMNIARTGAT